VYECSNFYLWNCRKVVYAKSINFCKKMKLNIGRAVVCLQIFECEFMHQKTNVMSEFLFL